MVTGDMTRPKALTDPPTCRQVQLDVREDIRRKQEPFARIMAAVNALQAGEVLVLRAPFEPIPLYAVLGKRGLRHWTERTAPDDWTVWFYRGVDPVTDGTVTRAHDTAPTVLDVRGLEPPQPMVRILEALEQLRPGECLEVHHDRRPLFLYPQLDERGFLYETDELSPGLVRIRIRRESSEA